MSGRFIDPREQAERVGYQSEGWRTQRDMQDRDDDAIRFNDDRRKNRIITQETFVGFRADVGANATTSMHVDFRSSTTTVATQGQSLDVPAQARVLVVRIAANADVTAGTATPQLSVIEDGVTSPYLFEECELSTAVPRTKSAYYAWNNAVQIAKDATFQMQLVTDGAYLPTTNDYTMRIVLGYEEWISS